MINKFFNRQSNFGLVRKNSGFAFTASAVVVAVLIGMVTIFLRNYVSVNTVSSAKHFSSNQAFWSSMSGIDYLLQTLEFDAGPTVDNFIFDDSSIDIVTTVPGAPDDLTRIVTSAGTHGGHPRTLTLTMQPPTPFDNTFFSIDSTDNWTYDGNNWGCGSASYPTRYWGSSCDTCTTSVAMPEYILLETGLPVVDPGPPIQYMCYWMGVKEQNPHGLQFLTIKDLNGLTNIEISLWIAAGVDVSNVNNQSRFQNQDFFQFVASDGVDEIVIEKWSGPSGFGPLSPEVNIALDDLTPQFQQFTFNISDVFGQIDSLNVGFVGNTNASDKYTGFAGLEMSYDMHWVIDVSSLHEI